MRTIKLNGKKLDISASEERLLFTLFRHDFAAKRGDFVEGRGNYIKSILPEKSRWEQLGISEVYSPRTEREKLFFKAHPRCKSAILGKPRRIKAIFKALDTEVERSCKEQLEFIRHETLTIPSDAEMEREIVNLRCDY